MRVYRNGCVSFRLGSSEGSSIFLFCLGLVGLLVGCAHEPPDVTSGESGYQDRFQYTLLSPGAQFATLPPAVQNTVRAETGSADIERIVKGSNSGRLVYVIYFRDHDLYSPLYVAPDSSVLTPELSVAVGAPQDTVGTLTGGPVTGVTLSDLPPKAVKAIQQYAPDAEIDYITKETHADQVTYIVTFKNHTRPILYIGPDGTIAKRAP